jgi:hypothetical protein
MPKPRNSRSTKAVDLHGEYIRYTVRKLGKGFGVYDRAKEYFVSSSTTWDQAHAEKRRIDQKGI